MTRALAVVTALAATLVACELGSSDAPPPPAASATNEPEAPTTGPVDLHFGIDFDAVRAQAESTLAARDALAHGFQCGWRSGWMHVIATARSEGPGTFRARATGGAFALGAALFVAAAAVTLAAASFLPRIAKRRRKKADAPRPEPSASGWASYFKESGARLVGRIGRVLRVDTFDPVVAGERTRAVYVARDIERQLALANELAASLAPEALRADAATALDAWRSDVVALRKKLEARSALPRELSLDHVVPRLDDVARAARELRIRLERAMIGKAPLDDAAWSALAREIADRPATPREREQAPRPLLEWVRPLGWGGLGALALGVPMIALWSAAGAFPLALAFLFTAGGLGMVLVARVHLHRAGNLPLLPGFADRVASWLTTLATVALLMMLVSSWMSSESGLDLGDPPPVPMPDPAVLHAPSLWP